MSAGMKITVFLMLSTLAALAQQPRIDRIQNNYSYLLPDHPSYGIAQGSIFIIRGANLAPSSTDLQNIPLGTTLNGVSARVTVNGTSTDVLWYYVTPAQLGGILPSATPVGNGTITVTTAAGISPPAPIKVVRSAFGVLTLNGTGAGAAAVFDARNAFLSEENSTKAGDVIQLFGSGIGPVNGDESRQQTQADLTSIPLTVEIGGVSAAVLYRGRTIYPGLDQINVLIPGGVTPGCAVPLTVRTDSYSSNSVTIPVSSAGGKCPAPAAWWNRSHRSRGPVMDFRRTVPYRQCRADATNQLLHLRQHNGRCSDDAGDAQRRTQRRVQQSHGHRPGEAAERAAGGSSARNLHLLRQCASQSLPEPDLDVTGCGSRDFRNGAGRRTNRPEGTEFRGADRVLSHSRPG